MGYPGSPEPGDDPFKAVGVCLRTRIRRRVDADCDVKAEFVPLPGGRLVAEPRHDTAAHTWVTPTDGGSATWAREVHSPACVVAIRSISVLRGRSDDDTPNVDIVRLLNDVGNGARDCLW